VESAPINDLQQGLTRLKCQIWLPDQVGDTFALNPEAIRKEELRKKVCRRMCRTLRAGMRGVNPRGETVLNDTRAFELKFAAFITSRG
jgi:hypothetical protein